MNLDEVKEIIDKINSSQIAYFEMEIEGMYIKIDKSLTRAIYNNDDKKEKINIQSMESNSSKLINTSTILHNDNEVTVDEFKKVNFKNEYIVKSPMVGTFYESPGIGKDAFVKVGDKIKAGDTLCIIEAMKLMNEIECDVSGEVIEVIAKNGSMVEYGAELFRVRRD